MINYELTSDAKANGHSSFDFASQSLMHDRELIVATDSHKVYRFNFTHDFDI